MHTPTSDSANFEAFASLHVPGAPLILPNAWDAASAAVIAAAGAKAVATTSGGAAWSLGAADGNALNPDAIVALTERIAAHVAVPVSIDMESGFSRDPQLVAALAARVHAAGASGINLEDTWDGDFLSPAEQAARVAAIRAEAPLLFINARIDAYLYGLPDAREQTSARLAAAYEGGAHAVFVPGLTDLETLADLVKESPLPVGVMAGPGGPSLSEFAAVGVARISLGTQLAESAYRQLAAEATAVLQDADFEAIGSGFGYVELNALMG